MNDFLEEVSCRVVLGDGDLGTAFAASGHFPTFPEELNLSNPDAVTTTHTNFLTAGAEVIRTNSLHARADNLKAHGLENRMSEIHWLAAQLAKSAARGTGALVAGAVSQEICGTPSAYQARIGPLLDGGADLLFFENFTSLEELIMALQVKQALHHCPAVCLLSADVQADLTSAFQVLEKEGADLVGGPFEATFPSAPGLGTLPKAFLVSHQRADNSTVSPEAFAELAVRITQTGGGLLLGGQGITSSHVNNARKVMDSF